MVFPIAKGKNTREKMKHKRFQAKQRLVHEEITLRVRIRRDIIQKQSSKKKSTNQTSIKGLREKNNRK